MAQPRDPCPATQDGPGTSSTFQLLRKSTTRTNNPNPFKKVSPARRTAPGNLRICDRRDPTVVDPLTSGERYMSQLFRVRLTPFASTGFGDGATLVF
jgi:hypothetical protein